MDTLPQAHDVEQTLAERRLALLQAMAEIGLDLTRALHRHVLAGEAVQTAVTASDPTCRLCPPVDFGETSLAFSRISRAVRMTLMLQARLEAAPAPQITPQMTPQSTPPALRLSAQTRTGMAAVCETASPAAAPCGAESGAFEAEVIERLRWESPESLTDLDDEAQALDGPLQEVVGRLCADLGVNLDLSVFAEPAAPGPIPPAQSPGPTPSPPPGEPSHRALVTPAGAPLARAGLTQGPAAVPIGPGTG